MLVTRDPLTGLLATPVLREALEHEVASADRYGPPSLVVVDVADYENWVESCGALRADLVMRGLSSALRSASRRSDVLGLLGPGRLCLVLPRTPAGLAQIVARRVRTHCARLGGQPPQLVVGLVHLPAPGDVDELLAEVDAVMLDARTNQGLRVVTP